MKEDNKREPAILSYNEWNYLRGYGDYWKGCYDYERILKEGSLQEKLDSFTVWTLRFLKEKYPNSKYRVLRYKQSLINKVRLVESDEGRVLVKDTVAFNIGSSKPELYLFFKGGKPMFMTEQHYDAYEMGPFMRPTWSGEY